MPDLAAIQRSSLSTLALGPPRPESASTPQPSRTIDWNMFHPSDPKSLPSLLGLLAFKLDATVFIATTGFVGQLGEVFCSAARWDKNKRLPPVIRSGLLESTISPTTIVVGPECDGLSNVLPQLAREVGGECALAGAITFQSLGMRAGLVVVPKSAHDCESLATLAEELPNLVAEVSPWFEAFLLHRSGVNVAGWKKWFTNWRTKKAQIIATVLGIGACAMAISVPYWPRRDCMIEPAIRQYVASPFDGRIKESLVRPGDQVTPGQLLARMHDEDLQAELSTLRAQLETSVQKRSTALANGAAGEMQIAKYTRQEVQTRIDMINDNLSRLEVRSPMAGTIVQGDWSRSTGNPIQRGGTLFEIAALDKMTIQTHLHPDDLAEISAGEQGTLRVDSAFGRTWTGRLERIEPHARIIDDTAVFVAEMTVDNAELLLRPGAKGTVRIQTGTKTVGWLLFFRPLQWLMKKVAW